MKIGKVRIVNNCSQRDGGCGSGTNEYLFLGSVFETESFDLLSFRTILNTLIPGDSLIIRIRALHPGGGCSLGVSGGGSRDGFLMGCGLLELFWCCYGAGLGLGLLWLRRRSIQAGRLVNI